MTTATTLAAQQETFMSMLLDDSQELPAGMESRRVAIYRNAYRARMVDALRETYPRTARWVGDAPFAQAAAHHVISHPPSSWTLDAVGKDFSTTLATLFSKDPEVSELAWLEWAMHICFVSGDATPLDAAGFTAATAGFEEDDWAGMRIRFLPGTQQAAVTHRVDRLWRALAEIEGTAQGTVKQAEESGTETNCQSIDTASTNSSSRLESIDGEFRSAEALACVVWRQAFTPICQPVSASEGHALAMMAGGAGYGELCLMLADELGEAAAASEAGGMLGRWLNSGMIVSVSRGG